MEAAILKEAEHFSRYVARLDQALKGSLRLDEPFSRNEMAVFLDSQAFDDEEGINRALRELRKTVMLRLICRDLSGLADMKEVVETASSLAEIAIERALSFHEGRMREQFGAPIGHLTGYPQMLHVVAMGKLGGGELNVSSDIDLVFAYPEDGETAGPRVLSNQEYFRKLGRKLIASLSDLTANGFVFRVDMRLRPYGESGSLASSFAMLEDYFVTQGREWERYAWIKGRAITGNRVDELMKIILPFVYRKYLDFSAFGSMRDLHAQIRQQVRRREMHDNIKLGPGGIREIEFIVQVFQLIRGGRDTDLRIRSTVQGLDLLGKKRMLPEDAVKELKEAYVFLRNLEHRLQYLDDAQTQDIPSGHDDRQLVAAAMGFADFEAFLVVLDGHRLRVEHHFAAVFSEPERSEAARGLDLSGFDDQKTISELLDRLKAGSLYRHLPSISQKHVDGLVPMMAKAALTQPNPDQTLRRMLDLLETVSRRSAYLSLLTEYPYTLEKIARLAGASLWASDYLRLHPILLDELLDERSLNSPIDWASVKGTLDSRLKDAQGDVEREMIALREIHHATVFQLLVRDLEGLLELETLSDHLTELADLILEKVLERCWREMKGKHREQHRFAIIGYGKLGGKELGYASDLDIVFLYEDEHPNAQETYARLAQRINTWLTSSTSSGVLYETDLRLRPNGASGLLVSAVHAFESYQMSDAWVWEHQALTRGRFAAGCGAVGKAFEEVRRKVLRMKRDEKKLKEEIASMRQKMHEGHPNPSSLFDIKHDRGGIVDVEFIVQFLVLAHAHDHPELMENIGNIALLRKMGEAGLIDAVLAMNVQNAYRKYRQFQHRLRLSGEKYARTEKARLKAEIAFVLRLWELVFEGKS